MEYLYLIIVPQNNVCYFPIFMRPKIFMHKSMYVSQRKRMGGLDYLSTWDCMNLNLLVKLMFCTVQRLDYNKLTDSFMNNNKLIRLVRKYRVTCISERSSYGVGLSLLSFHFILTP